MSVGGDSIAKYLISRGCFKVSLNPPFVYGSGLKGPVYCDNRKLISYPKERSLVLDEMRRSMRQWGKKFDAIVGIATGGIPYGFALAQAWECPFLYVRSQAKGYGKKRALEGDAKPGSRVVLVEDLVNQGTALQRAARTLREENLQPMACFSLVDYQTESARKVCREENLEHIPLTNLDALLEVVGTGLSPREKEAVNSWRLNPQSWKP